MENVLNRLSGAMIDISGKNLERTAMVLLSEGNKYSWERKQRGSNQVGWEPYKVLQREIILVYALSGNFHQPGKIIAPQNLAFPVVDFVFSWPPNQSPDMLPVVAFQCTWRKIHNVKLNALCTLRRKHMMIPDTQMLEIYMVCPKHEVEYAERAKEKFLEGRLDSPDLQTVWDNTKLLVIRPESSWKGQISAYLDNN